VTVVRDAKAGDPNFDANRTAGSQVIINDNGAQKTVDKADVKN
jgi:hypothetical protein